MTGRALPTGTVTFLFTDIEGSTRIAATLGEEEWTRQLEAHRRLLRAAFDHHAGCEVATEGDGFLVAFERVTDAIAAAVESQLALSRYSWPTNAIIRVRIGVHTGEAAVVADNYVGVAVHEAARISAAAHGGQIVLSKVARDLAGVVLPDETTARSLGTFQLRDIADPVEIFQLDHARLRADFSPLRTAGGVASNLPLQLTSFIGRSHEVSEIMSALSTTRVLTLLGPGGVGKTRTAIEVANAVRDRFPDGVWMADLSPLSEAPFVVATVADAVGFRPSAEHGVDGAVALAEHLKRRRTLVLIDNCEHLIGASADLVATIVASCPDVRVLATSRERLAIDGEHVVNLLPLGADGAVTDASDLFRDRARMHDASFDPDPEDIGAIEEICRRLDGLPLAIELAASQVRVLAPAEIAERLADRLGFGSPTSRTKVERQRTLRSAIDWGYELLTESERTLLTRLTVFSGGFVLDAVERICSGDAVASSDVLNLLSSLVDKSFVMRSKRGKRTRYWLLETIREYASEKLNERPDEPPPASGWNFVREGDLWSVGAASTPVRLRDSKGLRYLAVLLSRPGVDVLAFDLMEASDPGAGEAGRASGDAGEVIDQQAVAAYRQRLAEISAELDEARSWNDIARVSGLEAEAEAIGDQLGGAVGLGGRVRRAGSAVDRARMSVTKAIRAAIAKIGESAPEIGRHLEERIQTGTHCRYDARPDDPAWSVRTEV